MKNGLLRLFGLPGIVVLSLAGPTAVAGQDVNAPDGCSYVRCALRIEPGSWFSAGHLVRGAQGEDVAQVRPWTDLATLMAGVDSAAVYAERFQTKQRWGTGLYLIGQVVAVVPIVRHRGWDDIEDGDLALLISAELVSLVGAMIAQSGRVDLSRMVWWYNSQYASE